MRFLSTGQRHRAGLARVMASDSTMWLLDEPGQRARHGVGGDVLEALIAAHRAGGGAVLGRDASADRFAGRGRGGSFEARSQRSSLRELRRSWTSGGLVLPVAFFLLVATLFPFAIGPDGKLLARVGGGVIWAAALLAALLPVERLIAPDAESGMLDQFAVRGLSRRCRSPRRRRWSATGSASAPRCWRRR